MILSFIAAIAFITTIIYIVRNSFVEWSYDWNEEAMEVTCKSGRKRKFYRKNGSWFDDGFNLVGACSQQGLHDWLQAKLMEIEHQAKHGR